ncbi:ATP-dependent DNA ligase [Microbacterium sp. SORGH_AS_0888]|uniref:ATP-dependent DNA ligase n=1 Tax=Microbacterium sp. SORGH_AS_0888 TaxID=3041791 RepID=UPI002781A38A|nr:ATP-dependent DNA ligase [Microbacterium sp. SORGH_AS_0888]MDQ1128236.1 bifunctional non-homologous end joining protein LigD [Microbacterium sp. SORGH_AS_0888]
MAGDTQLVRIDGRRLRLSNLEKVLYPATGTTKAEVIDYYSRVAHVLIPHIAGRPVTRKRWPEGVGTENEPKAAFFAKSLEQSAPDWLPRMPITHSSGDKDYPLVEDTAALVYLAQVASLELHVPQWRFLAGGGRGPADRLVLDLDPGPGTGLAECAHVARWARDILGDMGLAPFPVTSGSKGLHLYAALPEPRPSDEVAAVAHELARAIEADHGDLVVSDMSKARREGRVLIDWSQNNGAKTTIAPYSLRGRALPTVAAPRTWDELEDPALGQLRLDEVLARVATQGDPLAPLSTTVPDAGDGPLRAYIAKRAAGATPEPVPSDPRAATPPAGRPSFVIQEHHASRLHWDFRLERDGVLVSWAVPKGVPPTSARNSLAVMTEDHPLDYGSFEGTIPRGQYGGGKVWIWDAGTYDLEKWHEDEIIVTLRGRPEGPLGNVRLALIRTSGAGERSSWLLHRTKTDADGAPQPRGAPVVARADDEPAPAPPAPARAAMLTTTATVTEARRAAERWRGDAWAELKWDGIRALGSWDGRRLRLHTRTGTDVTDRYPELTRGSARLGAGPTIVDGEIVALDASGRPSFALLQRRMNLTRSAEIDAEARRTPVRYYLFDALRSGGHDLTSRPLRERRAALEELGRHAAPEVVVPPVFDDLDDALAAAERFDLEGVVLKRASSRYRGIRSEEWLKLKRTATQEVVIGGIRPGKGARAGTIGSLLVGLPEADGLRYLGRVGTGFSDSALALLDRTLRPLRSDRAPFTDVPAADARDALWVEPCVVGEVEYGSVTPGGVLRHARWRGLRPDKSPAYVVRE